MLKKILFTSLPYVLPMVACVFLAVFLYYNLTPDTNAANRADWKAGNIISDAEFTNANGMSEGEIQTFLDKTVNGCDPKGQQRSEYDSRYTRAEYAARVGWPGPEYTCINMYYEVPKKVAGNFIPASNYGGKPIPSGAKSAAWIIKDAATTYNINPKVLLVKLATESAGPLTADKWPLKYQYDFSMGAHCPDSGPGGSANCDPTYAGFSLQMYSSAKLLRGYLDGMDQPWWGCTENGKKVQCPQNRLSGTYPGESYKVPFTTNAILWNVKQRGCGAANVYLENKATTALYYYTPYQPNDAALNDMYGTGDNCSAYGNRNFWRVYVDWFGSTNQFSIDSKLLTKYQESAGIGQPTMSTVCGIRDNGCYQHFANGSIYWSQNSGAQRIGGGIKAHWNKLGGEWGKLGYPVSGETYFTGGAKQEFQGGVVFWLGSNERIDAVYNVGSPTMAMTCGIRDNGCYQHFANGSIYWSQNSGAQRIGGGIRAHWNNQGAEWGKLGYPLSDETYFAGGAKQEFQGGTVYWENSKNAAKDHLGIGTPLTELICGIKSNGCYQHFANGSIYWSQNSGAQRIGGGIRAHWNNQGAEWGKLGYPLSDETYFAGGAKQEFQGGTIAWLSSSNTTLEINNVDILRKYLEVKNIGVSSMPTVCGIRDNGCYQHFANGSIYWSQNSGAQRIGGGIRAHWNNQGAEWGKLGYPLSDETYFAGGAKQEFQGGTIAWNAGSNTTSATLR